MREKFPEICDLVAVTFKNVDYYGYVDEIDFDLRHPRILVEFFPGQGKWFDFSEIRYVEYPKDMEKDFA